jgi:hypothetical protein
MATLPFDVEMRKGSRSPGTEEPGPADTKTLQAMAFYSAALKEGPRKASEVLREGLALGHTKRTQERARSRLHIQKIPPTTWQGPWLIALQDHPAVEDANQRRKEKDRKKQKRKANGRKRRVRDGSGRKPRDEVTALPY